MTNPSIPGPGGLVPPPVVPSAIANIPGAEVKAAQEQVELIEKLTDDNRILNLNLTARNEESTSLKELLAEYQVKLDKLEKDSSDTMKLVEKIKELEIKLATSNRDTLASPNVELEKIKGPITVVCMTKKTTFDQVRLKKGDKFVVKDVMSGKQLVQAAHERMGNWMRCVDDEQEKIHRRNMEKKGRRVQY